MKENKEEWDATLHEHSAGDRPADGFWKERLGQECLVVTINVKNKKGVRNAALHKHRTGNSPADGLRQERVGQERLVR